MESAERLSTAICEGQERCSTPSIHKLKIASSVAGAHPTARSARTIIQAAVQYRLHNSYLSSGCLICKLWRCTACHEGMEARLTPVFLLSAKLTEERLESPYVDPLPGFLRDCSGP